MYQALPDSAGTQGVDQGDVVVHIVGEDTGSQTVRAIVGHLDHLIHRLELNDGLHRAKDLDTGISNMSLYMSEVNTLY